VLRVGRLVERNFCYYILTTSVAGTGEVKEQLPALLRGKRSAITRI
jgi:hypothetical protein